MKQLLFLSLAFVLTLPSGVDAQQPIASELGVEDVTSLRLDDVQAGRDRKELLELHFRALSEFGEPVDQLTPNDVVLHQDGVPLVGAELLPFRQSGRGVAAVLVFDVSPSMKQVFEETKAAASLLLDRLDERDELAIVSFAGEVHVVAPFGLERREARDRLAELQVDTTTEPTRLFDAVYAALRLVRDGGKLPRRALVIVLSDGTDGGTGSHDLAQIVETSRGQAGQPNVLVYTIGYRHAGGSDLAKLRQLAARTGADYMEDLTASYQDIWDQSDWTHVVRVPAAMDGRSHEIRIEVNGHSASRKSVYPEHGGSIWPIMAATAAGLLLLGLVIVAVRRRTQRHLTIGSGSRAGERLALRSGSTEIGRSSANDIVLDSINVSGRHAELTIEGGRARLRDRGSTNGTFVNGAEIKTSCELQAGDEIMLGDVEMIFG